MKFLYNHLRKICFLNCKLYDFTALERQNRVTILTIAAILRMKNAHKLI